MRGHGFDEEDWARADAWQDAKCDRIAQTNAMNENSYTGLRTSQGLIVLRPDGTELPPRFDLRNHSPTGFECGYGGSGPAQLSLALLADTTNDYTAVRFYRSFTRRVIATLSRTQPWTITIQDILQHLKIIQEEENG